MRWVRRLVGVALVAAVLIGGWRFAAANATPVAIHYLWGDIEVPLWQALVVVFGAGLGVGVLGWMWSGTRSKLVQRRYRKAVGGLESELHQLRNLPLAPDRGDAGREGPDPGPGSGSA